MLRGAVRILMLAVLLGTAPARAADRPDVAEASGANPSGPGEVGDGTAAALPASEAAPAARAAAGDSGGGEGCPPFEARYRSIPPRARVSAAALLTRSRQ